MNPQTSLRELALLFLWLVLGGAVVGGLVHLAAA